METENNSSGPVPNIFQKNIKPCAAKNMYFILKITAAAIL
jgi:hypothetical protein